MVKATRGFEGLVCPGCGETDTLRVTLDAADVIECSDCDGLWTPDAIRRLLLNWEAVLAWVESAPKLDGTRGEA